MSRHPLRLLPLGLSLGLAATLAGKPAAAQTAAVPVLSPVTITGQLGRRALDRGPAQEKAVLDRVPGGTNLIEPQQEIKLMTLNDALAHQPGIVVQEFFGGNDQPRLNIRGSGIQSNPVNRGVLLMQDGLPLNEADGSFVIGFLEPRNASLISVRRGSNAGSPAATTLGGEMDFQSLVGTDGDMVSVEGGSFGRRSIYLGKGLIGQTMDGRIAFSHDRADGYRHHSASERTALAANFGYRNGSFENRTYLSYIDLEFEIPNVIPRDRLYSDPRSVLGDYDEPLDRANNIYLRDPNRHSRQFRLANRSYWGSETLNQTVGVYWQTIDDTFTSPQVSYPTRGNTFGAQWQLAGRMDALEYRLALDWSHSDMDRRLYAVSPQDGSRALKFGDYDLKAENRNAMLGLVWHMAPQWQLVGDLKFTQAIRDSRDRASGQKLDQDWSYISPRLGVVWQPSDALRLYTNVSRSNEAPTYWEIINGEVPQPMNVNSAVAGMTELDLQRATTFEIGGNGRIGSGPAAVNWSLSLYRSNVRDELMAVSNAAGTASGTFNYSDRTRHQGIELGLNGSLPGWNGGAFDYRLAYTLSDFRFMGGEYEGNRIAGVPRHLLSAELLYRVGGWRFGPNVRWLASDTPTNHQNVPGTEQDAYALLGFRIAYEHDKHWSAFLAADNLTDKTYASSYVIRQTATAAMPTFLSGNGRSIVGGLTYRY
ncbi:TonB-dependent receptor [Alcaligenaceae bacterium]|nr:TonB-dependent receptor [Alcaligenaceae bacterium]